MSSTVRDTLLGGDHSFQDRGEHRLEGIEGSWRLYELTSSDRRGAARLACRVHRAQARRAGERGAGVRHLTRCRSGLPLKRRNIHAPLPQAYRVEDPVVGHPQAVIGVTETPESRSCTRRSTGSSPTKITRRALHEAVHAKANQDDTSGRPRGGEGHDALNRVPADSEVLGAQRAAEDGNSTLAARIDIRVVTDAARPHAVHKR